LTLVIYVTQTHLAGHARNVRRLIGIERAWMAAFGHRTESAAARAQVSQDHEGRGAAMKALVQIGTSGRFAHRVQIQPSQLGLQLMDGFKMRARCPKPGR
jgi:hypothetical protein